MKYFSLLLLITLQNLFSIAKTPRHTIASDTIISSLRFIGEYDIPFNEEFKNTTIGGLSGIDYDKQNKIFYFISDDRSAINPARFYTADIQLSEKGIESVKFLDTHPLLQANGKPFPSAGEDLSKTVDPESIRLNAKTKQLIWTSEGERQMDPLMLVNPSVNSAQLDGKYIDTFPLPENLIMSAPPIGPRQNGALESLTFTNNFNTMYIAVEEPLHEDGVRSDVAPGKYTNRIFEYNVSSKKWVAQYAYPLDPIAHQAEPPIALKVNGISEILSLGKEKLLVIERSFSVGHLGCVVKVYTTDLRGAKNVAKIKSLAKENPTPYYLTKKLLLNMEQLNIYIDNIEGVTFGPDLSNGHKTLLFVSDNNFKFFEKMQLLLFEVIP